MSQGRVLNVGDGGSPSGALTANRVGGVPRTFRGVLRKGEAVLMYCETFDHARGTLSRSAHVVILNPAHSCTTTQRKRDCINL
eukprot:3678031-Rhodomonas_salina.1